MYVKNSLKMKYQDKKYPDSNTRSKWLKENSTPETRGVIMKGMHFILGEVDLYTLNIYEKRDMAVSLIKEGKIEEALAILDKIGDV